MHEALPPIFDVPLFPLPDVILFPGMLLPLHVFEERYRIMLRDILAGPKLIAIGHLQPGWESSYYQAPPVYEILSVGRIAAHHQLEDGSSSIAVVGLMRCRLRNEPIQDPYRLATVVQLADQLPVTEVHEAQCEQARLELLEMAESVMRRRLKPEAIEVMTRALKEREGLGPLTDFLASIFVQEPLVRQALLEKTDVLARARMLLRDFELLDADEEPSPPPFAGDHRDFGLN